MRPETFEREVGLFMADGMERDEAESYVRNGYILPRGQSISRKDFPALYDSMKSPSFNSRIYTRLPFWRIRRLLGLPIYSVVNDPMKTVQYQRDRIMRNTGGSQYDW